MKNAIIIAALILTATLANAQIAPPVIYTVEANYQQDQELPPQQWVQGADVAMRYRLKSGNSYLDLSGLTARWEGRSSATSTQALVATGEAVTNATPHYFAIALDSTQTGTDRSNWVYRVFVVDGSKKYPLGVGRLDIPASEWTGAAATLVTETSAAYTDAAVSNHAAIVATTNSLGHVIIGAGIEVTEDGTISASSAAPSWDSVTDKPETFPPSPHDYTSITNPPWLESYAETNTLSDTLSRGNTSGANDIILSANGLDQSRRIGFRVNDGLSTTTEYLDSIIAGRIRYAGSSLAYMSDLSGCVETNSAAYLNLLTNTATKAQGEKADTALQSETDPTTTNLLDLAGTRYMTGQLVTPSVFMTASDSDELSQETCEITPSMNAARTMFRLRNYDGGEEYSFVLYANSYDRLFEIEGDLSASNITASAITSSSMTIGGRVYNPATNWIASTILPTAATVTITSATQSPIALNLTNNTILSYSVGSFPTAQTGMVIQAVQYRPNSFSFGLDTNTLSGTLPAPTTNGWNIITIIGAHGATRAEVR